MEGSKMELNPALDAALCNIMDTMTGANTKFMALRGLLECLDKQACDGDAAAIQLIDMVHNFSRLIDIAVKEEEGARKG